MKKIILVTLISIVFISQSFAQKGFQGTINFAIEYVDLPEEMASVESMLPHKMVLKIKGDKSRMEQNSSMVSNIVIENGKDKTTTTLMDMMGNKVAIKMDAKELEKQNKDTPPIEIIYSDETKKIAGYTCKKAEVKSEGIGELIEVYYTNEIRSPKVKQQFEGLKGFPMKYEIQSQGLTIIMTASEVVKGKISDSEFTIPDGYELMTMEEFKTKMESQMLGE